jgi:hypothetical protein
MPHKVGSTYKFFFKKGIALDQLIKLCNHAVRLKETLFKKQPQNKFLKTGLSNTKFWSGAMQNILGC